MRENNNTAMENEMNKMKVRNLRWGESCGGMACGPIEGSSVVELCVTWKGGTYFIADSCLMEFEHIFVSPMPLFDVLINMDRMDVDTEEEYNKVSEASIIDFECEIDDELDDLDDLEETEFRKAIEFVRYALQTYFESSLAEDEDYEMAQKFIEAYVGEDILKAEIPEEAEAVGHTAKWTEGLPETQEEIVRERVKLEAMMFTPSVWAALTQEERDEAEFRNIKLMKACESAEDYFAYRDAHIDEEEAKLRSGDNAEEED